MAKLLLTVTNNTGTNGTKDTSLTGKGSTGLFYLNVSSLTGTAPTLDVAIEDIVHGQTYNLGSFTQATGTTNQKLTAITNMPSGFRINYTFGGTVTDADFTVSGELV